MKKSVCAFDTKTAITLAAAFKNVKKTAKPSRRLGAAMELLGTPWELNAEFGVLEL